MFEQTIETSETPHITITECAKNLLVQGKDDAQITVRVDGEAAFGHRDEEPEGEAPQHVHGDGAPREDAVDTVLHPARQPVSGQRPKTSGDADQEEFRQQVWQEWFPSHEGGGWVRR